LVVNHRQNIVLGFLVTVVTSLPFKFLMTIFLIEDPVFRLEETVLGLLNLVSRDEEDDEEVILSSSELAVDSSTESVHFLVRAGPSIMMKENALEVSQQHHTTSLQ
jgi:hypothetical protein